ncbi:MAG: hypothetical protein QXO40_03190 [Candidatus Aenigmatarchaeota archaeon]
MKEKIKTILTGILIGIIAFPTLTLGGTFVVSLIQGKSVEEAIQILAEQIDALIGRVERLETKQETIEVGLKKEIACRRANELYNEALKIWNCSPGSQWWGPNAIEGTIDALIICLQNRMSEKPWLLSPNDPLSSQEWYQNKLTQLNTLNSQFKLYKVQCNE